MEIPGALWRTMIFKHCDLPSSGKLVGAYLSTWMDEHGNNCYPSIKRISHETSLSEPTVCKYIAELRDTGWLNSQKKGYDGQDWARNQYYPLIPTQHIEDFTRHLTRFSASLEGTKTDRERHLNRPRKALNQLNTINTVTNTVSSIGGKNGKRFIPPSIEDVKKYCHEKNKDVDAEQFCNFYESKGWYVGKNKMKSWKHAVALWHSRNKTESKPDPREYYV